MILEEKLKQKITKRFLKKMGSPLTNDMKDIYLDLLNGEHTIKGMFRGKYTVVEILYEKNGYEHHFLGVAAKNPKDFQNTEHGLRVASEEAFMKLFVKFYLEENGDIF